MNFYFNYFLRIGREQINCGLWTVDTCKNGNKLLPLIRFRCFNLGGTSEKCKWYLLFRSVCTKFAPSIHKECIMSDQSPQPIELHCRAVLHLSPEHFTIRGG